MRDRFLWTLDARKRGGVKEIGLKFFGRRLGVDRCIVGDETRLALWWNDLAPRSYFQKGDTDLDSY
jgi:hypothetical protein